MQIVIDIPESKISKQQNIIEIPIHFVDGMVIEAGGYGFDVLPKGHGDLIDRIDVLKSLFYYIYGKKTLGQCIDDVQTIIEAVKEV